MHPPFQHRFFPTEAVAAISDYAAPVHREYLRVIQIYPVLPGAYRIRPERVIMIMDHVLGRHATLTLLKGNAPTVLATAGSAIESHLSNIPIPNRDLQLNLLANIVKECGYVEKIATEQFPHYIHATLEKLQLTPAFQDHVVRTLIENNNMLVPWQLIESFRAPAQALV